MALSSVVSYPEHHAAPPSDGPGRCDRCIEDRTRIAQELHDTLLQGFFGVSMRLQAVVEKLPPECGGVQAQFGDVLDLMQQVIEQGRSAVQGLRNPAEWSVPLGTALAEVPGDLGLRPVVGFRVVVGGKERALRAGIRHEVYRIGREAILNACRHARARDIEAEVDYRSSELRIAVRDDGCGIDPKQLQWGRRGHWGLQGMRERAERIGGRLRILSGVARGTEVELCVPGRLAFEGE